MQTNIPLHTTESTVAKGSDGPRDEDVTIAWCLETDQRGGIVICEWMTGKREFVDESEASRHLQLGT